MLPELISTSPPPYPPYEAATFLTSSISYYSFFSAFFILFHTNIRNINPNTKRETATHTATHI